jgi:hypothetical protein
MPIKVTLGRDSTSWVVVVQSTGKQLTFGSKKPTREQIAEALIRASVKGVITQGIEITELPDAG